MGKKNEGRGSQGGCGKWGCHDCQRARCDPTTEIPHVARGPLLWGIEKGRSARLLPPLELPRFRSKGDGWGPGRLHNPRRQSHPLPRHYLCRDTASGMCGPHASLPGLRAVRGPAEKNSREDQVRGQGRRQNLLQLGIKTEQVQRSKPSICRAAAPGLHPLRVGPIKSWAEQEHGRPQGSAWNSEK